MLTLYISKLPYIPTLMGCTHNNNLTSLHKDYRSAAFLKTIKRKFLALTFISLYTNISTISTRGNNISFEKHLIFTIFKINTDSKLLRNMVR